MSFVIINHTVQKHLIRSFALLDEWFDRDEAVLCYKPEGAASIAGLMKSIVLNNQHLLHQSSEHGHRVPVGAYRIDIADLGQTARHWRFPKEESFDADLVKLRRQLRGQLDEALELLEISAVISTEEIHPLASAESGSWDGFHRLYFIGLLIRQYMERFESIIHHYEHSLIEG